MERCPADILREKFCAALAGNRLILDKFQILAPLLAELLRERLCEHLAQL